MNEKQIKIAQTFLFLIIIICIILLIRNVVITGNVVAEAGNATQVELTLNIDSPWIGIYGNLTETASYPWPDSDNLIKDSFNLSRVFGAVEYLDVGIARCYETELYATTRTLMGAPAYYLNSLVAGNVSKVDELLNISQYNFQVYQHATGTATLNESLVFEVGDNNITTNGTYLNPDIYRMGLLEDPEGYLVYVFDVVQGTAFDGTTVDFEGMLPSEFGSTDTYYFFRDPTDECVENPPGWLEILAPEGVFEPHNASLAGTHINTFSISFTNLTIGSDYELACLIKLANGSLMTLNETGLSMIETDYTLNYTLGSSDSIINSPLNGYQPWILKNCSLNLNDAAVVEESVNERIYVHSPVYWSDDEITRAVACEGTPGVYFNNTMKCEFSEDTMFALQMRNGNEVNESCFNNAGVACSDSYCNGIYFPTCDPVSYFGGYSALTDDPNGYTAFTASFASYDTAVAYSRYTNTSTGGNLKVRIYQALTSKTFSLTLYNLTNVSGANVYGAETGSGITAVTDNGDGTWNVAHNRLATSFTGVLDLVFNISFDAVLNENRSLKLVLGYGVETNQGNPPYFDAEFSSAYGLSNNFEGQNSSATTDTGGVCGDEANNDFDYLGGTWAYSYDCFDQDCHLVSGDESQSNEFGSGKTGLCNYQTELDCDDEFDNDYDYLTGSDYTDCHDADCFQNGVECLANEMICNDSINNDWDYTKGESDYSSQQKIANNGTKYTSTYSYDLMDCEDSDCNGKQGGNSTQFCSWGYETNCSDSFDNDALQLRDCELAYVSSRTAMPTQSHAEYDCSSYCRINELNTETGSLCDDNLDNDWDAVVVTGYYSNQYSSNSTSGSGIDCRWGGYFSYGTNYNPDEDCNMTTLSNGKECQLAFELNCTDGYDNDFDGDASGMPNAGWSNNQAGYLAYFGVAYSNDADYDDYDCQATSPSSEADNASWCFDNADNDLDAYYWTGVWTSNSSTGIDCSDPDCMGVTNPADENETCLEQEYNDTNPFFQNLAWPGMYCANGIDDDADGPVDCYDSDCYQRFGMCSLGPCYDVENIIWNSCADSTNNDYESGTDCADSDCVGMIGSTNGGLCLSSETICDDGFNNDASGGTDCGDSDCYDLVGGTINSIDVYCKSSETGTTSCYDGFDNDNDGSIDCYDSGCDAYCNLYSMSGSSPITLPQMSGQTAINSVSEAYILTYTRRVRKTEWYNITFKMTTASTNAQWTLGTASGATFNKSSFDTSGVYLAGPNAGNFTLTETVNGFIIESDGASLPSGYTVSFLIQSTELLGSLTYELTYAEATESKTSLNNYVYHQVVENVVPEAHSISIVPNSTNMNYGSAVYLRANASDNYLLGKCDWYVYGAATFNPSDSTQCKGSFSPTVEGTYYVNVTPIDYYSNTGSSISESYNLNILPTANSISSDERFYLPTAALTVNATFNLVASDTISTCEAFVKNDSTETSLGTFSATANNCYNDSVDLSSLEDGVYTLFVKGTESTEANVVESSGKAIFVCSQSLTGVCQFADFNDNDMADYCAIPQEPNMTISKTDSSDPVVNGSYLNYTITYQNNGLGSASNVTITENYPSSVSFVSSDPNPDSGNNVWDIGTVASGVSGTVNVTVQVNGNVTDGLDFTNSVNMSYQNSTGGNFVLSVSQNTTAVVDDTSSPTISSLGCVPDPASLLESVVCSANTNDNIGLDTVLANVTHYNGSVIESTVSCSGTSTSQSCNFTFISTNLAGLYNVTWWVNDTSGNIGTDLDNFTVEAVGDLAVVLDVPANGTITINQDVDFICNASSSDSLSNLNLYLWNNSGTYYSNVNAVGGTSNNTYWNLSSIPYGKYNWSCLGTDTQSNTLWGVNRSLTIYEDNVDPVINVINCTPNPGYLYQNITCSANVTDDYALDSIIANVSLFNMSVSCSGNNTFKLCNFTFSNSASLGLYNVSWRVNDTSGNYAIGLGNFSIVAADDLNVTLVAPPDSASTTLRNNLFICNASSSNYLKNLSVYVWNSSEILYYYNYTNLTGAASGEAWGVQNMGYDAYTWNCLAHDLLNNSAWGSANYTVTITTSTTTTTTTTGGGGGGGGGGSSGGAPYVSPNQTIVPIVFGVTDCNDTIAKYAYLEVILEDLGLTSKYDKTMLEIGTLIDETSCLEADLLMRTLEELINKKCEEDARIEVPGPTKYKFSWWLLAVILACLIANILLANALLKKEDIEILDAKYDVDLKVLEILVRNNLEKDVYARVIFKDNDENDYFSEIKPIKHDKDQIFTIKTFDMIGVFKEIKLTCDYGYKKELDNNISKKMPFKIYEDEENKAQFRKDPAS
jgi:hypothetical protein